MIRIMLDSASDGVALHPYDHYVPLTVEIDGNSYLDGINLKPQKFYKLLTASEGFPKTSQPSPEAFAEIFETVKTAGDELVYLCLSSALSGTFKSATIAKEMVEYDGIYIIDTRSATHMIGMLARHADKLRQEGLTAAEIVEKVTALREKQVVYAGLQTLEYLYKGGRLSRTSAAIGSVANIKPIITVSEEGKVESFAKAIGIKRAIATITKQVQQMQIDPDFPIWSLCSVDTENCEALEKAMETIGHPVTGRMQVGPTIGAHVGPGVYGIAFVQK